MATEEGLVLADVVRLDDRVSGLVEHRTATSSDEVLDATEWLAFSGSMDPHGHSRDPGLTHKEAF